MSVSLELPLRGTLSGNFTGTLFRNITETLFENSSTNLTCYTNEVAPGQVNPCEGFLIDCLQGYCADDSGAVLTNWYRIVSELSTKDASRVDMTLLENCMDADKMNKLASNNPVGGPSLCALESTPWHDLTVKGGITGLSPAQCIAEQNEFIYAVNGCENSSLYLEPGIIAAIGIGSLLVAVAVGGGVYNVYQQWGVEPSISAQASDVEQAQGQSGLKQPLLSNGKLSIWSKIAGSPRDFAEGVGNGFCAAGACCFAVAAGLCEIANQ